MNAELMSTPIEDMTAEEMGQSILDACKESFAVLNRRREKEYAAACEPLDAELDSLAAESDEIEEKIQGELGVLAHIEAAERVKRFEADQLLLQGETELAQAKLEELDQIKATPARIEVRRRAIAERFDQIEVERRKALRIVAGKFRDSCFELIRGGSEMGHAQILDATRYILNALDGELGSPPLYQVEMLTADAKSEEWDTLSKLYARRTK